MSFESFQTTYVEPRECLSYGPIRSPRNAYVYISPWFDADALDPRAIPPDLGPVPCEVLRAICGKIMIDLVGATECERTTIERQGDDVVVIFVDVTRTDLPEAPVFSVELAVGVSLYRVRVDFPGEPPTKKRLRQIFSDRYGPKL